MSPEAFLSRPYDVKTDLWSLGCIVYYLSALVPPFNASK
jgi:NIMA (never in mitosis gene a)-related kinase